MYYRYSTTPTSRYKTSALSQSNYEQSNILSIALRIDLSVEKRPSQFDIGVTPTAHALISKFEVGSSGLEVWGSRFKVYGTLSIHAQLSPNLLRGCQLEVRFIHLIGAHDLFKRLDGSLLLTPFEEGGIVLLPSLC